MKLGIRNSQRRVFLLAATLPALLLMIGAVYIGMRLARPATAAMMSVSEDASQIQIDVPNRYRAILQKGDTTDFIVFYDRAENDSSPNATQEIVGPCIVETNTYCLRDDANRRTTVLESSDTRVRIRVTGGLNNEASTDYLDNDAATQVLEVSEDYTFTYDGVFVENQTDFKSGLGLDADSGHNGYEWLGVLVDGTDAAFDDTANITYGDGATEATTTADDAEFTNTNTYVVLPGTGTSTYQDAVVGITHNGWYDSDSNTTRTEEWHWDEANTGTQDLISTQQQNYTTEGVHSAGWYLLLKSETSVDTETEREALANSLRNPDTPDMTTGSTWYNNPGTYGVYFDGSQTADGDTHVRLPNNIYNAQTQGTIEMWMKADGTGDNEGVLFGSSDDDNNTFQNYLGVSTNITNYNFHIVVQDAGSGNEVDFTTPTNSLHPGQWQHIAWVNSGGTHSFYIDGVAQTLTGDSSGAYWFNTVAGATTSYTIGCFDPDGSDNNDCYDAGLYEGVIDDVRIWSSVRTQAEIQSDMHTLPASGASGLIGYFPLDEGTGTTTFDQVSTNDGTLNLYATWKRGLQPDASNQSEGTAPVILSGNRLSMDLDGGAAVSTTLNGALTARSTTITVTSTTGFASSGVAYIDGDKFSYTGITSTTFTGVPSSGDLAAIGHASGAVVSSFTRENVSVKARGLTTSVPTSLGLEGSNLTSSEYSLSQKPVTNAQLSNTITWYSTLDNATAITSPDIGSAGTANGPYASGKFGNALNADSGGTTLNYFPTASNISGTANTIEFWYKKTGTPSTNGPFFGDSSGSGAGQTMSLIRGGNDTDIDLGLNDGTTHINSWNGVTVNVYDGDWHHIRVAFDSATDAPDLWLDGIQQTRSVTAAWGTLTPKTNMYIGEATSFDGSGAIGGLIDEFTVYSSTTASTTLAQGGVTSQSGEYLGSTVNNYSLSLSPVDSSSRGVYFSVGSDSQFSGLSANFTTLGASSGALDLVWEYWNGSSWKDLESMTGFSDGTKNFTTNGVVHWDGYPPGWAPFSVNGATPLYVVRVSLANTSGSYSTTPVEETIKTDILTAQLMNQSIWQQNTTIIIPGHGTTPSLFWQFDEGNGTSANDTSSNGNTGTITNATYANTSLCVSGNCLAFDGSGDYVSRADDSDLDFGTNSFTISAWIKHPTIATSSDFLSAKYETTGTDGGYKVWMDSSGNLACGIDSDNTSFPSDSVTSTAKRYDDDTWHHVDCVKTSTSSLALYVDGQLAATDSSITSSSISNNDTFYVGIDGDGSTGSWDGLIDQFKVYPYARSSGEVKSDSVRGAAEKGANFAVGHPQTDTLSNKLLGYWRLDESSGNAVDSSGHGLTLTNNATTPYAGGKFGNGSSHTAASSQYFSTVTTISGVQTVSFWVKPTSTTNYYLSLTSGASITSSSGTLSATGFTNPSIYVNGTQSTSITANVWSFVTVTTTTAIDANQFYIGRQSTNYFDGVIDEVRVYGRAFSPADVSLVYAYAAEPIGYWKLDEGTGTSTVKDSSTTGSTLTINGTMTAADWQQGKYGSSLHFDGTDDSLSVTDPASYEFSATQSFSLSAWVNHDNTGGAIERVIAKRNAGADPQQGYHLAITTADLLTAVIDDGTNTVTITQTVGTVSTAVWHHVAVVFDRVAQTGTLYVDGVVVGSGSISTATGTTANASDFRIGRSSTTTGPFDGLIDEARIYNYARTNQQVVEDMNGGHPTGGSPVTTATSYWKFDELSGTSANDTVATSQNTLTLSSASWSASGKYDGAWNGTGAVWLSRADDADFDVGASDDYSIALWIKSDSASNPGAVEYIVNKANATTAGYALYANTSGNICFGIDDDATWGPDISTCSTGDIYDATWHYVVAVRDVTADVIRLSVDGKQNASTADSTSATLANGLSLYIGDRDGTDNGDEFNGDVDELKILRTALTPAQVAILYNANSASNFGVGTNESSLATDGAGNSPVLDWRLDENSGVTATDTSGNNLSGTLTNSPTWTTGKYGSAVSFAGSNQHILKADDATLDFGAGGSFTIETWFKHSSASTQEIILSKYNEAGYKMIMESDGDITCAIDYDSTWTPTDSATSTAATYDDGSWHHLVCVKNANTSLTLYIDGIQIAQDTSLTNSTLANSDPLYFGIDADGTSNDFTGTLDNFTLFNYARASSQIAYDYNRGAPAAWYKMDECTGATLYNSAVNANGSAAGSNGTWSGASGTNTSAGTCTSGNTADARYNGTSGKRNASLDFDGTDDSVSLGTPTLFGSLDDKFSLSVWIKPVTIGENSYGSILTMSSSSGTEFHFTLNGIQATNAVQFRRARATAEAYAVTDNNTITLNQWNHVVVTFDSGGTNIVSIYINGKEAAYLAGNRTNGSGSFTTITSNTMYIGNRGDGARTFDGLIDDVRVYNYVLSQNQIGNIMNEGAVRFGPDTGSP